MLSFLDPDDQITSADPCPQLDRQCPIKEEVFGCPRSVETHMTQIPA